jgi:hypothetical protein
MIAVQPSPSSAGCSTMPEDPEKPRIGQIAHGV